ncbi:MAG: hypothetical protein RSE52_07250 [Erysipelotrichaceae bacterium]
MSFVYANGGSGPSSGGIGWFDFGSLVLNPGDVKTGLSGTLSDGTKITFDMKSLPASIVPFTAVATPLLYSYFGYSGYTGLLGNTALFAPLLPSYSGPSTIVLSNIVAKDVNGNVITNFTGVVADGESTNKFPQYTEYLKFDTTGGPWNLLTTLGPNPPTLAGVGSNSVLITGTNQASQAAYVFTSLAPNSMTFEVYGREAVAFGFATTRISIRKRIGSRINSADQFDLNIAGTPNNQVFTSGASNGIQNEIATIYALPGNTYTINEAMAPGSISSLGNYTIATTGVNLTPGGQTPPLGTLPITVTPQLGDNILYTITNAAPETFEKTVDKQFADLGDILTYKVTIHNPNEFAVDNVLMSDSIPTGTSYAGNLLVNLPYTGTNPATGITIPSLPGNSDAIISWQVKVDAATSIAQINNVASISIPSGTSGNTNIVKTMINNADLNSSGNFIKTVDKTIAQPGDILTYNLSLHNTGNVSANQVVVTDLIPQGTTYVAASTIASLPFSGDPTTMITLNAPIGANTTATISFKVKVGNTLPLVNPIPNKADVNYAYTVDPALPNGSSETGTSNTVETKIIKAQLSLNKTSDKNISYLGDTITYQILVKNNGNVALDLIELSDAIPNGTSYIPGSLSVSAPFVGTPAGGIKLTNSLVPGASVAISFQVKVIAMPNPNPIENQAKADYKYTLNPLIPNGASGSTLSNKASTLIFKNNYQQQISDLIESVALEEAALAAIANSEGAKIQAALAIHDITPEELLCINKSVQEMMDSLTMLEAILKQKLAIVNCQINGEKSC